MKLLKKILFIVSSVLTGIIFVFSGFVKVVDPLGSTYKFIDYFDAFHLSFLNVIAFPLAFVLSGLEFLIGICLIVFIRIKTARYGALIFMIFFTPLTLYLAIENPVSDCGCFGDAIVLSNWDTFYKNLFILALIIIAMLTAKSFKSSIGKRTSLFIIILSAIMITLFSWYNYRHLPVIDFRPYEIGTYIPSKMIIPENAEKDIYTQHIKLLDTVSGKEIELTSEAYTNDSTYWGSTSTWKYLSITDPILIKKGYVPPIHDFTITTADGSDITQDVLNDSSYFFLLVAYDLKKSDVKRQAFINDLYRKISDDKYGFLCLTSVSSDEIEVFKNLHHSEYEYCTADPITLKTIIRANPGLVLLHKGVILAKWHYNDIPEYEEIMAKYFTNE
jgi:uncharacterized membrane protein YphA (DoxX/SURF4 family)